MNVNKIVMGAIGIMVAVVMIGGAFLPAVNGALHISEPITEYNIGTKQTYREVKTGDVFQLVSTYDEVTAKKTDVWTLNGETVVNSSSDTFSWNVGIISDSFWINILSSGNASSASWYAIKSDGITPTYVGASSSQPNVTWRITVGSDTISWTYNGEGATTTTAPIPYTWAFVPCSIKDGRYMSSIIADSTIPIVNNIEDIVLCGTYSTGELDTCYYYYKGETYVNISGYTGENTTELTLHNGTYDLYDATIKFAVSNGTTTEEFTPFRALVPYEVNGYSDEGVIHSMISILPIVGVAGLVIAGVYVFISRK